MKKNNGITLIALVITIIVLLILAGVSIAMLGGSNGILGKASDAKATTAVSEVKDEMALAVNNALTTYYDEVYVNGNTTVWTADDAGKKECMDDVIATFTTKYGEDKGLNVVVKLEGTTLTITSGDKSSTATVSATDGTVGAWTDNF